MAQIVQPGASECSITFADVEGHPTYFSPVDGNQGHLELGNGIQVCCEAIYHPDAAIARITACFENMVEPTCPSCNKQVNGVHMVQSGATSMDHARLEEVAVPSSPRGGLVKAKARNQLLDEVPQIVTQDGKTFAISSISVEEIRALMEHEGKPPVEIQGAREEHQQEGEGECLFDCQHAGPIAILAGIVFGFIALVKWMFSPGGSDQDQPKKNAVGGGRLPMSVHYADSMV